jgi:hypothetical protein
MMASAAGVVALSAALFWVLRPAEPPAVAPSTTTTTTTTTTTSSTTTTVPGLPVETWEVATVKPSVRILDVKAEEPAGWSDSSVEFTSEGRNLPPSSASSSGDRPALPRPDLPVAGRYAVPGGWWFENPGPYTPAQPFTLLVTERRGDWAKVMVPVRPNGTQGWVRLADVDLSTTDHRISIRLGERMLRAYEGDRLVEETPIVVGTASTQTPTGLFYLTDKVPQPNPAGAFGPIALPIDGYSEMMDTFDSGVPVIALHGTNRPELLGQARSNGCIRMPNEVVLRLADRMPQGTPVHIWP